MPSHRFKKGDPKPPNSGRKKGTPNRVPAALREFMAGVVNDPEVQQAFKNGLIRVQIYSGQRWGAVQEGMAPAFTKATGIDAKIITFPISQGYARILNALGV